MTNQPKTIDFPRSAIETLEALYRKLPEAPPDHLPRVGISTDTNIVLKDIYEHYVNTTMQRHVEFVADTASAAHSTPNEDSQQAYNQWRGVLVAATINTFLRAMRTYASAIDLDLRTEPRLMLLIISALIQEGASDA